MTITPAKAMLSSCAADVGSRGSKAQPSRRSKSRWHSRASLAARQCARQRRACLPDRKKPRIAIVDYGMGNLFSVKHACEQVGLEPQITSSPQEVLAADAVIL